jgi:hypothetical protein
MAAEDYFDMLDPYDDQSDEGVPCQYCKKKNLEWVAVKGRWRLIDENGEFHNCRAVASPSEFKAVT